MHHDFILHNVNYDFLDIFQSFGLKPYLAKNSDANRLWLAQLLWVWCYKTDSSKTDIENVSSIFQLLTKSCGKALDMVHAQNILHQKDLQVSPLLPAIWAVIDNLKKSINSNYFSINQFNVFKHGEILPGLIQYTLDNVRMTQDGDPHTLMNVFK